MTTPGDIVTFIDHAGNRRRVCVFISDDNIMNGFAGFVGAEIDENGEVNSDYKWWGYDASILEHNGIAVV